MGGLAIAGTVWIGANDQDVDGQFVWADTNNTQLTFSRFMDDEPNGGTSANCTELRPHHDDWNDDVCTNENYFVCEFDIIT